MQVQPLRELLGVGWDLTGEEGSAVGAQGDGAGPGPLQPAGDQHMKEQ